MSDLLKKAVQLGLGLAVASKEKIEQFADELVAKGELGKSESRDFVNQLMKKGEEQRDEIKGMVREQVAKVLAELDIATRQDLRRLETRIAALEAAERQAPAAPAAPVDRIMASGGEIRPDETAAARGDAAAHGVDAPASASGELKDPTLP